MLSDSLEGIRFNFMNKTTRLKQIALVKTSQTVPGLTFSVDISNLNLKTSFLLIFLSLLTYSWHSFTESLAGSFAELCAVVIP